MTPEEIAELTADIRQRVEAIGEKYSDEKLTEKVKGLVAEAVTPFERKTRFGEGDDALKGSKFGRKGLKVEDVQLLRTLLSDAGKRISPDLDNAVNELSRGFYVNSDEWQHARAMDTAESGYGSQLIGAQYVGELWRGAEAQSRVFALIPQFNMTAPTAYLPVPGAVPEMLLLAESTASDSSNYTTSKTGSNRVSVTAAKLGIHQMWSGEMEEDSIIPFIPFLREEQQRALAYYADSLVINGDTTNADTLNINSYDANPADTKHYLAFDGIRHACLVDNTANATSGSGAGSYDKIRALPTLMLDTTYLHDWGHPNDPNDLVFVTDPQTADEIALYDEVITVDKYGPAATVLTGEVTKIGRHPLVASIAFPLTNNDGMVKATGNTYGNVLGFNRRAYVVGVRRSLKIETERIPATDQTRIVLTTRLGLGRFTPTGAASGIESAAILYNI